MDRHTSPILDELAALDDTRPGDLRDSDNGPVSTRLRHFAELLDGEDLSPAQQQELGDAVAAMRQVIPTRDEHPQRHRPRADSPHGLHAATALPPLDEICRPRHGRDRERGPRNLWLYGAYALGVTAVMAALLALGPVPGTTTARPAPTEPVGYPMHQTAQHGDLAVVFSYFVELKKRSHMYFFTVNFADKSLQGGVTVDDGEGHQAEIVPESDKLPPKSVQGRSSDVPADFNGRGKQEIRLRKPHQFRSPPKPLGTGLRDREQR